MEPVKTGVPVLSPEFFLVATCCIWPPSERRTAAIRKAVDAPVDWNRVMQVVKRQRAAGLVHDGLSRAAVILPAETAAQLRDRTLEDTLRNFRFTSEAARIQHLLEEKGVPALFVKGVSLAQLAYGTLGVKHSWDIDLLVPPEAVLKVVQILEQAGYRGSPALPPTTDRRHDRWLRYGREYALTHETGTMHVELHWKLADNAYFLSGITAHSAARMVNVAGQTRIRTLGDQELFAYLCVHGAMHGWSRIKWLADAAALIANDSTADLERRMEFARKVNADICAAQAFLLCDRLFGTPALSDIVQKLRRKARNRILERVALAAMTKSDELIGASFGLLPIYLSHFLLGRGWRYRASELWSKLNGPYDLIYFSLPRWLGFLYAPLRIASWVVRGGRIRQLPAPPRAIPD
jgi:hypothetical protein